MHQKLAVPKKTILQATKDKLPLVPIHLNEGKLLEKPLSASNHASIFGIIYSLVTSVTRVDDFESSW